MCLDFNFTTKLMLDTVLDQLRLEQDFESNYVLALRFPGQVDVTKFTLAKWSTNFKVTDGPFFEPEEKIKKIKNPTIEKSKKKFNNNHMLTTICLLRVHGGKSFITFGLISPEKKGIDTVF